VTRQPHVPGTDHRLRQRLIELGYVQDDGSPDASRFMREHRQKNYAYDPRNFYAWLNKGRTPSGRHLDILCENLGVSRSWLVFGEGPKSTRRGGKAR
jgi:hypothetical protein